ncbi:hypothetical protein UB51_10610 [Paenibacillus sp. IHBB 10380]|nr:hypothetical protein UB51_10610 [Paenibacillus sp. IHBB 10380]
MEMMHTNRLNSLDQLWFKLRNAQKLTSHGRSTNFKFPADSSYMLFVLTEGNGKFTTVHGEQSITERSVYVSAPGENLSFLTDEYTDAELFVFQFDIKEDTDSVTEESIPEGSSKPTFPYLSKLLKIPAVSLAVICNAAYLSSFGENGLERFRSQYIFQELLHRLFNELMGEGNNELDTALEQTRMYIEQHYREPLSVKRLAGVSKISPRHLVRMFKNKFEITPMEYVQLLRLD